jgi:transcriptional regulator with XRE-family HTH domain
VPDVNQDKTLSTGKLLLGTRLREARLEAKVTLREMARRVGVSPSFMSQVERDLAAPSVGTLYSIVSELGLSLDSVMQGGEDQEAPEAAVSVAAVPIPARGVPEGTEPSGNIVHLPEVGQLPGLQRAEERPEIFLGGVRWERLTPSDDAEVEFLRVTYRSGSESCRSDNLTHHGGKEYFHVLSGRLDVQVAFARQTLTSGDSINFDSSIPHRLSNPYEEECVAIWFVVGRQ